MKTYILKLRQSTSSAYYLYDGDTQVSDTDLTALFATAGEAYFQFDFDSKTPGSYSTIYVVDSQNVTVMTKVDGFTAAEGKNFKGEWGASTSPFTSFAQLPAYGLDESQLATLVSKMGEGGVKTLTTADYNWPTSGTKTSIALWLLPTGVYVAGETVQIKQTSATGSRLDSGELMIIEKNQYGSSVVTPHQIEWIQSDGSRMFYRMEMATVDNLTTSNAIAPLSANQGKVLNEHIGDLTTLTTTTKTSTVAAINELVTSITGIAPLTGNSAPTTSTVGEIGQIYLDTTNDKVYILKSIEEESGQPDVYTWEELGGGGGSYDVFTTNEWNALWS